jgi:hypothetical protein
MKELFSVMKDSEMDDEELREMGRRIAESADWEYETMLEVFKYALIDANFHDTAEIIQRWIEE